MSYKVVNIGLDQIEWGIEVILPTEILELNNTGIANGDLHLSFQQFSDNTEYSLINGIAIEDHSGTPIPDVTKWIEDYYNNPMIAYYSDAGQGDMRKDVYDSDYNDIVDSSESIKIKTLNINGDKYELTAMTSNYQINPIGVIIDGIGTAIKAGRCKLKIYNRAGGDAAFLAGAYVYVDTQHPTYGKVKKVTPGGTIQLKEHEGFVGVIAEDTVVVPNNGFEVCDIILDIRVNHVENPENTGIWLRQSVGGIINAWTEEINGGQY